MPGAPHPRPGSCELGEVTGDFPPVEQAFWVLLGEQSRNGMTEPQEAGVLGLGSALRTRPKLAAGGGGGATMR